MRIEIEEVFSSDISKYVVGFADSSYSSFEQIRLQVRKDSIRCMNSTCLPVECCEEYINLYYETLQFAKRLQQGLSDED